MRLLKQSTAVNVMVFMTDSADHIAGKAGLTLTITLSKDGGAFAAITPTVTDRGNGWYNLALTASHTDTLGDICIHITSTGADPSDLKMLVVAFDANSATNLGLTNLDGTVSSRLATAGYTAPDNASITAIKAKTDNLPSDPADASVLAGLIETVDTVVDAIKLKTDNLPSDPADQSAIEAKVDSAVSNLKGLSNKDLTQVFDNTSSGGATAEKSDCVVASEL
jgi:hypothetical protein